MLRNLNSADFVPFSLLGQRKNMHSFKHIGRCRIAALATLLTCGLTVGAPAEAQELVHRFINPSFGGNPFYSEHLLGIANIHRPDEPEEPAEPAPTDEELEAERLRARFITQLSSEIRSRIENAKPGETGQFELGDQRISFTRTATQTEIVFLNGRTGETNRVIIPVTPSASALAAAMGQSSAAAARSAEQALSASTLPPLSSVSGLATGAGAGTSNVGTGSRSDGLLDSRSLEIPLVPRL